ncbi:uncharacterized protein LOC117315952 [Pecten maximus]|uniref:uncharacterized protein LOC117315952 n=1 Tax=Pecten maximus TaxID=6579 RepID=UPI001458E508|nr:uncharacterized protein LOC117315952 [Pecten maximus]
MATSDPMNKVDELRKCVICWERFKDPRQLQCGHGFCFECIDIHFKTHGKNYAPCPVCRKPYWPDGRDANNLPKSLILRQLVDIKPSADQGCETTGCRHNSASWMCLVCRKWLCDACKSQTCGVEKDDETPHNVYTKEQIGPGLFDIVRRSRHKVCYNCTTHDIEWFCPQCRTLVCKLCKANSHIHHKLKDISQYTRDTREDIKQTIASLQKLQQQHRKDHDIYRDLQVVVKIELFDASDCQKMMERCTRDIDNCDRIVILLTQLLEFGSDVVIVDTFRNLEERISTELGQCHSLEPLLAKLNSRVIECDDATATWIDACYTNPRKHLISDSGVGSLSLSEEGSVEEEILPDSNPCEMFNCVSNAKASLLCLKCKKWTCDLCSKRRCDQNNSNHDALSVQDMGRQLYDVIQRSRNHTCAAHTTKEVTHFCQNCNVLVCTTCRVKDHLDHTMIDIIDKYRACCKSLKSYKEKLQYSVRRYKLIRQQFSEIQQSPYADTLNPSYCEDVLRRCDAGIDTCEDLITQTTYLRHYGIPPVVIDMFRELNCQVEDELKVCPSDFVTPLRRMVCVINDTLEQSDRHGDDRVTSDGDANADTDGPESSASTTPLLNGAEASSSNVSANNAPDIPGSARRRVVMYARNAASEIPNNPNASEESNAKAHISYGGMLLERIIAFFRYIARVLSGSS